MNRDDLQVENISISLIHPNPNNVKNHSVDHVIQIQNSIREFGFNNPIIVDENNVILAGHGRYMAADGLNYPTVPVIRITGLSESQKRGFVIADNKLVETSTWDELVLLGQIDELSKDGFDLSVLGFQDTELETILNSTLDASPETELNSDSPASTTEQSGRVDRGSVSPPNQTKFSLNVTPDELAIIEQAIIDVKNEFSIQDKTQALLYIIDNYRTNASEDTDEE